MGVQENLVLEEMERLTPDGCLKESEHLESIGYVVKQNEPIHKPTGLMSIFAGCDDVW